MKKHTQYTPIQKLKTTIEPKDEFVDELYFKLEICESKVGELGMTGKTYIPKIYEVSVPLN